MRIFRFRRLVVVLLAISFVICMLLGIYFITKDENDNFSRKSWLHTNIGTDANHFGIGGSQLLQKIRPQLKPKDLLDMVQNNKSLEYFRKYKNNANEITSRIIHDGESYSPSDKTKVFDNGKIQANKTVNSSKLPEPNYNIHVFYYAWYGNPVFDKEYYHWAHPRLPHWDPKVAVKHSTDRHVPPDDIGSNFYPSLGPYSSRDPTVIEDHMRQIRLSGAGVIAVSWYPPGLADDNGTPWDNIMPKLLDAAEKYHLKVCFHIEPFKGRSAQTVRQWLEYIVDTYSRHPAFYRFRWKGRDLPLYYLYDTYLVSNDEWRALLTADTGALSVRGTRLDGYFIGLLVEHKHQTDLHEAGFDGYYTYFVSYGFSYGSKTQNWKMIAQVAKLQERIFIPSVGPGYVDDRVRPWNKQNTKERKNGRYYDNSFLAAISCSPPLISITSFNEWHEGTQIEMAVPRETKDFKYLDYSIRGPDFYLDLTRKWIENYSKQMKTS